MDTDFKDRFNYLAAFLAVIIGLAAFRDVASNNGLSFFGLYFSYLQLSLPLVVSMVLGAYLGALTLMVKKWNFTLFPLGKYLETFSYGLVALGLLYPLLIPIALLFSFFAANINTDLFSKTLISVLLMQVVVIAYLAAQYASIKEKDLTEQHLAKINELESYRHKQSLRPPTAVEIFERYEYILTRIKAYLSIRGYGVSGQNLGRLAQVLYSKNVFSEEDLKIAKEVTDIRNAYAHAKANPKADEARHALVILNVLDTKLGKLFAELAKEVD